MTLVKPSHPFGVRMRGIFPEAVHPIPLPWPRVRPHVPLSFVSILYLPVFLFTFTFLALLRVSRHTGLPSLSARIVHRSAPSKSSSRPTEPRAGNSPPHRPESNQPQQRARRQLIRCSASPLVTNPPAPTIRLWILPWVQPPQPHRIVGTPVVYSSTQVHAPRSDFEDLVLGTQII